LDAAEPALRVPLMALGTFVGMFASRTLAIGPAAFMAGYLIVFSQTLIDRVPTLEVLTRGVLWLWVVILLPVGVSVLGEIAFGEQPAARARTGAVRILRVLAEQLSAEPGGT